MRIALLLSGAPQEGLALATAWSQAGDEVSVVLLDGASAAARRGHADGDAIGAATAAGAGVVVHDEALRRRGISDAVLAADVKIVGLDEIADLVAEGADKAVWL